MTVALISETDQKMTKLSQTSSSSPVEDNKPLINDRLPVELMTEIFRLYLKSCDLNWSEGHHDFSISQTPFFLTKICQRWRTIAVNDASLWRNINLCFRKNKYKAQMELLKGWIDSGRAKSCPLTLSVKEYPTDRSSWELKELYNLISLPEYRKRWVSMDLFCSPICTLDRILGEFPNLKNLKLLPSRTHRQSYPFILEIVAPKIEDIEVHDSVRLVVQGIPFNRIPNTTIVNRCMEEVLKEFQEGEASSPATTTSLQYCNYVDMACRYVAPPAPIPLPALRLLRGEFLAMNASFCKQMLDHLRSPLLETLVLCFDKYDEPPWKSLEAFVDNNSGLICLRCFQLTTGVLDEHKLIRILEAMPQLGELFLEHLGNAGSASISSKIMGRLSGLPEQRNNDGTAPLTCEQWIILPRLSAFTYKGPTENITWSNIAGFLQARSSSYDYGTAGQDAKSFNLRSTQDLRHLRYFAFDSHCDIKSEGSDTGLKSLQEMHDNNIFLGLDIRRKGISAL